MTLRLLGWAAALGLIVALASVVFYGAGKTHICPAYLWVLFDSHEAITTLSPGGLLFGGRMAAPPGRHRPGHSRAEVFYAIHDAIRLLGDDAAWLSLLQVWVSRHAQKTRGSSRCSFLVYAFFNLISG